MEVLFIDACMKPGEESRTKILCNRFLKDLEKRGDCTIETVPLKDLGLAPFDNDKVNERYGLLEAKKFDAPMFDLARQFAEADRIVVGAPYWDLAFPAVLKIYIEHIFVEGITFDATAEGLKGLAKAEKALYIQTAGGFVSESDPGTLYLKYVMEVLGIPEFQRIAADLIDVVGLDVAAELEKAGATLDELAKTW